MTTMFESEGYLLIHSGYQNPAPHSHMVAQLVICPEGTMSVSVQGDTWECSGILIPMGVMHSIDTKGKAVLVLLMDCTTKAAGAVSQCRTLPDAVCGKIFSEFQRIREGDSGDFIRFCLNQAGIEYAGSRIHDPRILDAIRYIRCNLSEKLTCREVAEAVFLSQSRFSHLFKQQVGMTFAAYLVYQRLMYAYTQILLGKSITEAAISAGFSGSGHFADVNRRVFGLSASHITDNLIFSKMK